MLCLIPNLQPYLHQAVQLSPDDADALLRLALALSRVGDASCEQFFVRALAIDEANYDAHYRFAQVFTIELIIMWYLTM